MGSLEWGGYHSLGKEILGKVLQERGILWDEISLDEGKNLLVLMGNLLYGNLLSCELVRMGNDHEDESWSWAGKCSGRARGGVEASWACVLVSVSTELIFFLVAGGMLCFGLG